ncbi:hypothetical protein LEN26_020014 [Aphanomyces euteiches]|nr:hypothetical protein LEN26_020014 [Aphanomyces euteiches]
MGITYSVRALRVEPNGELVLHRRYKAYLKKHCPEFAHVRCHITQEVRELVASNWKAIIQGATPAMKAKGKIQPLVYFYDLFYNTLFVSAPETKPLFKKSIIVQGKALTAIIEAIVNAPSVATVIGSVVGLAYRHNKYGVKIRYYNVIGCILLHTIKDCTGDEAWTPTLEQCMADRLRVHAHSDGSRLASWQRRSKRGRAYVGETRWSLSRLWFLASMLSCETVREKSSCGSYHIVHAGRTSLPAAPDRSMGLTYSVQALRVLPNGELVLHRRYNAYFANHCPEFAKVRCLITQEVRELVGANWKAIDQGATPAMKAKGKIQPLVYFYDFFYNTLFVSAPETKPLFKTSIIVQGKAFIAIIESVVNAPSVATVIEGVVGLAILLQTLKECTGDEAWTPPLEHAWLTVYAFMLTAMAPVLLHGNVDPSDEELALAKQLRGGIKVKPVARVETALFDAVPPTQCSVKDAWAAR